MAWFFLRTFMVINGVFSLRWSYFLGSALGNFAYHAVLRHRKIALESLDVAFPNRSVNEKKKITRDFFISMAQSAFELLYFLRHTDKLDGIKIEGQEFLDAALKSGQGVILVTAHIGNFPLMSVKLAQSGYKVNFITRPMHDEKAGDYLYNLRENAGVKSIFSQPRRECVMNMLRVLRNNEIIITQIDQNFGAGGVWVKFFGKLAATPVGPITLSMRTKAKIIPAFIYRTGLGKHCIKIFKEEPLIQASDKDEMILKNAANLSHFIEKWITDYPEQWGWIHRRWKSQPSETMRAMKFRVEE
ncbi:MAG: lysophospholipid acyltransferase family protein [Candidatus Omnitrophota bacterium]